MNDRTTTNNAVLDYLRSFGVFLYVNTGELEPTYIAGMGRGASPSDIDAAIKFLELIRKELP